MTMNSQPLAHNGPSLTPAPRPAARARALRGSRRPQLRPTSDPHTLWRRRETYWTTLPWTTLNASLPQLATGPFINGKGDALPFQHVIGLEWPTGGMLTNSERRSWNRHPVTSTDIDDR